MNTYSSQITFTCTKKLIDQGSPNTSTYTSPTLLILQTGYRDAQAKHAL